MTSDPRSQRDSSVEPRCFLGIYRHHGCLTRQRYLRSMDPSTSPAVLRIPHWRLSPLPKPPARNTSSLNSQVRREKVPSPSGFKSRPATVAPAGSTHLFWVLLGFSQPQTRRAYILDESSTPREHGSEGRSADGGHAHCPRRDSPAHVSIRQTLRSYDAQRNGAPSESSSVLHGVRRSQKDLAAEGKLTLATPPIPRSGLVQRGQAGGRRDGCCAQQPSLGVFATCQRAALEVARHTASK